MKNENYAFQIICLPNHSANIDKMKSSKISENYPVHGHCGDSPRCIAYHFSKACTRTGYYLIEYLGRYSFVSN